MLRVSVSIAFGWSPVGLYASDVLNGGIARQSLAGVSTNSHRPPYGAYAAIMATFAGGLAAAGGLSKLLDHDPQCQTVLDLVVLSAAPFKASRTLARDDVTSFLPDPVPIAPAHE